MKTIDFVNPFLSPAKPEKLSQAGTVDWRPGRVLGVPGQERWGDWDPSRVGLHSSKHSGELWGLTRQRGEEHESSSLFPTCAISLADQSRGFCGYTRYCPLACSPSGTELHIAGFHPTREAELLLWPLPGEPEVFNVCFAHNYIWKCSPKIGGPCQVGQNRGGGLLPVNCVSGGEAV